MLPFFLIGKANNVIIWLEHINEVNHDRKNKDKQENI